ncbi:MAG: inositol monophosphatase family protein [Terriglobia bacterium]
MAFVFVSYAHSDENYAGRVEEALRKHGHRVWRDQSSLKAGTPIPQGVATGISLCDYLVIIATKAAAKSKWVLGELNLFIGDPALWDRILLLRFGEEDPTALSPFLRRLNPRWIDFRDSEAGLRDLLVALGQPDDTESPRTPADLDRLKFAIDLAVRAGNVAMRFYNGSMQRNEDLDVRKSATTRADCAAQNEVIARLAADQIYCHDGLISEEKPYNDETNIKPKGYTWVVDPLDGTANFDNKIPLFCTAIGCLRDRLPHLGVVFDPVQNEVYYAMEGMPTEVWHISKGDVERVSADQGTVELKKSLLGTHLSSRPNVAERFITSGILLDLSKEVRHLRALGCGHLALAYVASGRLQGFLQLGTYLWDQVAGMVLVRCAGGCTSDLQTDGTWTPSTKDILTVGNSQLSNALLEFWRNRRANSI